MTIETLSLGLKNLKFSNCSVSNQILGEGYLWLLWVLNGIIFSIKTQKCDLFMTQVDFMFFLRLWVRSIQALPNPVTSFTDFVVLSPNSPNIYRKYIHGIVNPRNIFFSLILNLPLDSSPCFNTKNNKFLKKTFSNLVFGDDFTSTRKTWTYRDLFYVLRSNFQSKEVNIML